MRIAAGYRCPLEMHHRATGLLQITGKAAQANVDHLHAVEQRRESDRRRVLTGATV